MQLLQNECQESNEQQTNVTQNKQKTKRSSSPTHKMNKFYPPKPKINAFNALFTCYLCQGYLINPTTIDVCTHTHCRSCITRHLAVECCCPQCGKTITTSNLIADDILRSIIFKLVPGLYQKERERLVQFVNNTKNEGTLIAATEQSLNELLEVEDNLFAPTDPISLSLEFHPLLVDQCPENSVPPVRYLQCPASVKVQHLKRFLYSKFEIDPSNRRVGIDIIYEDEILPSDFTLMDIGYCFKWQRHAPLKLTYRILIYNDEVTPKSDNGYVSDDKASENVYKPGPEKPIPAASSPSEKVSFAVEKTRIPIKGENEQVDKALSQTALFPHHSTKARPSKPSAVKHSSSYVAPSNPEVPVKVTISRKPSESKKSVSKKSSLSDEFVIPTTTNDFKSLRSNDIRFSDYAIISSTTTATTNGSSANSSSSTLSKNAKHFKKEKSFSVKEEKTSKCDIVVSIPHNQVQEEWDTKPLSHLKTASKKSPNPTCTQIPVAAQPTKKNRNVPKLKIELNSLKSKLIEKPKSADIRLDTLLIKHHRPRKFSLDESQPLAGKVDLETYVKHIGLKPIEVQTINKSETAEKYTPNASPMSSCSSTTSSSTGNFNFNCSAEITSSSSTSSSHKKRKKKHSKESREAKDSKRKKMHAEISSHSAEESLKMKVKLTPPINLKSLKSESKRPPHFHIDKSSASVESQKSNFLSSKGEPKDFEKPKLSVNKHHERPKEKMKSLSSEFKKSKSPDTKFVTDAKKQKDLEKSKRTEIKTTSCDNPKNSKEFEDEEDLLIPDSTSLASTKSLAAIKELNLPHSPPLPPSLFKTTPLTFSTFSPNVTSVAKPKPVTLAKDYKEKPKTLQVKPIVPKPIAAKTGQGQQTLLAPSSSSSFKTPHFAVPNPPRFTASNTSKFLSTPTSIASAANKHMGNLLKRSISLDDNKNSAPCSKQLRLEKPNQITVSAYGCSLQITKVDIPATPTLSSAKTTYEIPLYSPLSASYNPKCSFTVNSTTSAANSAKATLLNSTTSSVTTAKHIIATNAVASNTTDVDAKKATDNDIKASASTTTNTNNRKSTSTLTSTPTPTATATATTTASMATIMGPPLPMQKFNSILAAVPASSKSPPLNTVLPFATTSTLNSTSTAKPTPVLNTAYLSSPLSMVNYRQSKVLLAHAKPSSLTEIKIDKTASNTTTIDATNAIAAIKASLSTTNGLAIEKPKSSLRQFRLPSRESGQDILDLSASTKAASANGVTEIQSSKTSPTLTFATSCPITTSAGSSLEIALNKIKQNMTTNTKNTTNNTSSKPLDNGAKKQELLAPISDDLQNLHLLSDSATAREKINISTSTATSASASSCSSSSSSTSLYEKAKITQNSLVRQQNASVRNIPNPSALAFRNQQPTKVVPPMVTIAAGVAAIRQTDLDKPLLLKTSAPPKSPHHSSHSTTTSSTSTSPSRITTKKHPSIDQVAASLNQRASAAAEASAKANSKHPDETALVSSSTPSLAGKLENKEIKQEFTEMPSETSTAIQRSSTVNTCPCPVNILDIKKEPEEKFEETPEAQPVAFINVTKKKTSMVENLVTSVINVTTPTSTLLTATTAAGF